MKIGYARISTADQKLGHANRYSETGCEKIFTDRGGGGAKAARPELDKALDHIRRKGVLVIWNLDRLGRLLSHLLSIVEDLK